MSVQQVWRSYGCLETSQSRPGTCSDLFYLARKLVRVPFAPFSTGKLNAENETVGKEREGEIERKTYFFLCVIFRTYQNREEGGGGGGGERGQWYQGARVLPAGESVVAKCFSIFGCCPPNVWLWLEVSGWLLHSVAVRWDV